MDIEAEINDLKSRVAALEAKDAPVAEAPAQPVAESPAPTPAVPTASGEATGA